MLQRPTAGLVLWTARVAVNQRVPSCHYAKKWKCRTLKVGPLPAEIFSYDKPLSGSAGFSEDLAELNKTKRFDFEVTSMTARGFLRFQKNYTPPDDVTPRFLSLVKSLNSRLEQLDNQGLVNYRLNDSLFKFNLLSEANNEFGHAVPNSMLYLMENIGDVLKFYNTPIETITPFDNLLRMNDLPPNLHIQKEPLRFDPETDTMFGGQTAFPKSSTLVTGLHAKKKYKTLHVRKSWV